VSDHPLGGLVEAEVKRAEADLAVFRSRALSLVGLTGILVTFVSGLVAIAAGGQKDVLPDDGGILLLVVLVAYVAAAICALWVNLPGDVTAAKAADLQEMIEDRWDEDGYDQSVAVLLTKYLVDLRRLNKDSAKWLACAIKLEIAGMTGTAALGLAMVHHVT
jgi:hypothetical protein